MEIKEKISSLTAFILRRLNISYTMIFLNKICSYKVNMNFLGISKILSFYKIEQKPIWVEDKLGFINDFNSFFIAQIQGINICVVEKKKNQIYIFDGKSSTTHSINEFIDLWTGVALLVEKNKYSKEPFYQSNLVDNYVQKSINNGLIFLFLCLIGTLITKFSTIQSLASLTINFTGIFVCYLLINKQIEINNTFANKICTAFSKHDGCNTVLKTSAAKLFGWLSWSEVGFGFFLTNSLWILIVPEYYHYVLIFNCICILFSIWSIGYQMLIIKQWCILCLISQVLLWGFCLINLDNIKIEFINNWYYWGIILFSYLFHILLINRIVTFINEKKKIEYDYGTLYPLFIEDIFFNFILSQQTYYDIDKKTSQVIIGNRSSDHVLTIITNPFCSHCAEIHQNMQQLLFWENSDYCIQFVFNSYIPGNQVIDKLLVTLYFSNKEKDWICILDDWFTNRRNNPETFIKKHKSKTIPIDTETECERHWDWINKNKIIKTPLILLNGYKLPPYYSIEDLLFLNL